MPKGQYRIIKRISGGGTVLLAPGMLVWTLLIPTQSFCINQTKWFKVLSGWITGILSDLGIKSAGVKGVSDITIDNKKICGTALYIGANKILYHGTLLIDIDPFIFEKYLKIPDRMPDYRQSRSHSDFVTTLKIQGYNFKREEIIKAFNESVKPEEKDYLTI
jgi:lipoate---protein ligase